MILESLLIGIVLTIDFRDCLLIGIEQLMSGAFNWLELSRQMISDTADQLELS